jgi:hypothetical protein
MMWTHTRLQVSTLLIVALLASSCAYRYRFVTGLPENGTKVTRWAHIAGWGWSTPDPFDLEEMCPEGVARFGSHVSFLNWLPAFLTLGIYSPRTVVAWCAGEPQEDSR